MTRRARRIIREDDMAGDPIAAWLAYQQVRGFTDHTVRRRGWALRAWAAHVPDLAQATVLDVEEFLQRWKAASSRHAVLSDIRLFYDWAISRGVIRCADPTELVAPIRKPKRIPTPVSREHVELLVRGTSPPIRTMVMLGAFAGLRVSEMAALRGADVSLVDGLLVVRDGKGRKDRRVPLNSRLRTELQPVPIGAYFPGLNARNVSWRVTHEMRRLGVPGRPHDLRAAFGTDLARASGGNLVLVAKLMGHESMETTKRYVGWDPEGSAVIERLYRDTA